MSNGSAVMSSSLFPSLAECREFGRSTLRESADRFDETGNHETAAMLRYAAHDLAEMDEIARQRGQNHFLYDQWGLRIVHCEKTEPHDWHGFVSANRDVRCPGVRRV